MAFVNCDIVIVTSSTAAIFRRSTESYDMKSKIVD